MTTNSTTLTTSYVHSRVNSLIFAALALALGLTFPQLFHALGIGSNFLPMFLPTVLLALVVPLPFVVVTALITPLLNTLLFQMPPWSVTPLLTGELLVVGTAIVLLRRQFPSWIVVPAVLLVERFFLYGIALILPSSGIGSATILESYPGVLMNAVVGILVSFYIRSQVKE